VSVRWIVVVVITRPLQVLHIECSPEPRVDAAASVTTLAADRAACLVWPPM
jgi:hypothetical protein